MRNIFLLLGLMVFSLGNISAHPIKMTTSKLSFDKRTGQLTLLVNFFIDDFGAHLQKIYHQRSLKLESAGEQEKSMINAYVAKKLLLKINRVPMVLKLNAVKKLEENVLQATFIIPAVSGGNMRQLEITNTVLFDAFEEQVNVLHIDLPTKQATVLQFTPSDSYKAISLH